jgi:hypothetical protein
MRYSTVHTVDDWIKLSLNTRAAAVLFTVGSGNDKTLPYCSLPYGEAQPFADTETRQKHNIPLTKAPVRVRY